MNFEQYKRYQKLHSDQFYLLDLIKPDDIKSSDSSSILFKISGSTRNVYQISIKADRIYCDCPDAKSRAPRNGCVCKHCIFVLFRVLKLFKIQEGALSKTEGSDDFVIKCQSSQVTDFFTTLKFSPEEQEDIRLSLDKINFQDSDVVNQDLLSIYRTDDQPTDFNNRTKVIEDDQECPICYDDLTENEDLLSCPCCKNYMHEQCIKKWLQYQDTCVYCRSDIWRRYKKGTESESEYRRLV